MSAPNTNDKARGVMSTIPEEYTMQQQENQQNRNNETEQLQQQQQQQQQQYVYKHNQLPQRQQQGQQYQQEQHQQPFADVDTDVPQPSPVMATNSQPKDDTAFRLISTPELLLLKHAIQAALSPSVTAEEKESTNGVCADKDDANSDCVGSSEGNASGSDGTKHSVNGQGNQHKKKKTSMIAHENGGDAGGDDDGYMYDKDEPVVGDKRTQTEISDCSEVTKNNKRHSAGNVIDTILDGNNMLPSPPSANSAPMPVAVAVAVRVADAHLAQVSVTMKVTLSALGYPITDQPTLDALEAAIRKAGGRTSDWVADEVYEYHDTVSKAEINVALKVMGKRELGQNGAKDSWTVLLTAQEYLEMPLEQYINVLKRAALASATRHGSWEPKEDDKLSAVVQIHGKKWTLVSQGVPGRTADQCRYRWTNTLDPKVKEQRQEQQHYMTCGWLVATKSMDTAQRESFKNKNMCQTMVAGKEKSDFEFGSDPFDAYDVRYSQTTDHNMGFKFTRKSIGDEAIVSVSAHSEIKPGDQLIAVNMVPTLGRSQEEVCDMVQQAKRKSFTLTFTTAWNDEKHWPQFGKPTGLEELSQKFKDWKASKADDNVAMDVGGGSADGLFENLMGQPHQNELYVPNLEQSKVLEALFEMVEQADQDGELLLNKPILENFVTDTKIIRHKVIRVARENLSPESHRYAILIDLIDLIATNLMRTESEQKHFTLRHLYYVMRHRHPSITTSEQSTRIIHDLMEHIRTTMASMRITPAPGGGYIIGSFQSKLSKEEPWSQHNRNQLQVIDACTASAIRFQQTPGEPKLRGILLVESHSALVTGLRTDGYSLEDFIVITGSGFLSLQTREIAKSLHEQLNIPVLGLFDGDVGGVRIALQCLAGSCNDPEAYRFAIPTMSVIGMFPQAMKKLAGPDDFDSLRFFGNHEVDQLQSMLDGDLLKSHSDLFQKVQTMMREGRSVSLADVTMMSELKDLLQIYVIDEAHVELKRIASAANQFGPEDEMVTDIVTC